MDFKRSKRRLTGDKAVWHVPTTNLNGISRLPFVEPWSTAGEATASRQGHLPRKAQKMPSAVLSHTPSILRDLLCDLSPLVHLLLLLISIEAPRQLGRICPANDTQQKGTDEPLPRRCVRPPVHPRLVLEFPGKESQYVEGSEAALLGSPNVRAITNHPRNSCVRTLIQNWGLLTH